MLFECGSLPLFCYFQQLVCSRQLYVAYFGALGASSQTSAALRHVTDLLQLPDKKHFFRTG